MDFEDSFFDCNDPKPKKTTALEGTVYRAKRCEIGWFVQDTSLEKPVQVPEEFMLLKYKAGMAYYRKDFGLATQLFEQSLAALPKISTLVERELKDSLARCYLHLKEYHKAKEIAQQLVESPHENDSCSWRLKAQCHKLLKEDKDHILSLQKCVSLQRHHANYWLELAEGYDVLLTQLPQSSTTLGQCVQLSDILDNTAALFRPYFSWRGRMDSGATEMKSNGCPGKSAHENEESGHQHLGASETNNDQFQCPPYCYFSTCNRDSNCSPSDYLTAVSSDNGSATPRTICSLHSPFTMLVSRTFRGTQDFVQLLKNCRNTGISRDLLDNFYSFAQCSCFIWARHLLLYSTKCSSSFAKECQADDLKKVEGSLDSCDKNTKSFLQFHFNKRSIFDDCQRE